MLNKPNTLLYTLLSGALLSISWFFGLTGFIFIAFVPLLILENYFSTLDTRRKKLKLIGLSYLAFLTWNLGVTWWIQYASFGGAIIAWFANSLLMTIVFVTFSNMKNRINKPWGIWLLVPVWIAWEFLHHYWQLTWPWLTLGNIFAYKIHWIQWYEYTGVSGGSLWVLCVNILLFQILNAKTFSFKKVYKPLLVSAIPIALSYIILYTYKNTSTLKEQNILVVQPNIDPYNQKFDEDFSVQFNDMLEQIKIKLNPGTDYLVLPETFMVNNLNEEYLDQAVDVHLFMDSLIKKFPELTIITGACTYTLYPTEESAEPTARRQSDGSYVDFYNTGLQITRSGVVKYHKSKLVPGSEIMPYGSLLKPLESFALDLGGTTGSLGVQKDRVVFEGVKGIKIAPVICYESIYGDYCTEYIRKGANFIFIITNDGWWENTPGYKQHLSYARLRAIETRRSIARSANTGVSCFIDETGAISQPTGYWEKAVIEAKIKPNDTLTFFARFGDIISRLCAALAVSALLYYWFLRFFKR
jgi:apolipoprotein N-acyltransferase